MSKINDYRLKLQQQIATAQAQADQPRWGGALDSLRAQDRLGRSRGDASDLDKLRDAIVGSQADSDPEFRSTALGRLVAKSELPIAQQLPLEILADPQEALLVRSVALGILKSLAISSPTFSEWRPMYLEALRTTIATPELRLRAFAALISQGDRQGQELLVSGLENSDLALVDPADALNLLGEDPHVDVRALARQIVDQPPDERTLVAAIRHLAGDPASVDRLRLLVGDRQRTITARKLAAAALNALAPESLPVITLRLSENLDEEDAVDEFVRILARRRQRL